MRTLRVLLAAAFLALALPAAASAAGVPDPDAPPDSPPHWLPGEAWVSNHWLPYDERPPVPAAPHQAQRRLAAAARRPPQPRPARRAATAGARSACAARTRGALARRGLGRAACGCCEAERCGRSRRGTWPSTCSSTRCTSSRSRDGRGAYSARRAAHYLGLRRAELSPIQIGMLYGRSPAQVQAAVIANAPRACPRRRAHALHAALPGAAAAHAPGEPGPALAAAVALQRAAADAPSRLPSRDARSRFRATTRPTRRSPADGGRSPSSPTSSACRWP